MAEQCFTCSAMAHGISVAKLHRQSLRLLTLAQAVRKRKVQRAAAVFSQEQKLAEATGEATPADSKPYPVFGPKTEDTFQVNGKHGRHASSAVALALLSPENPNSTEQC